jgi:hypothetical protein
MKWQMILAQFNHSMKLFSFKFNPQYNHIPMFDSARVLGQLLYDFNSAWQAERRIKITY